MSDGPKRDWEKTWVHFFCGAVVGAIIGVRLAWSLEHSQYSWAIGATLIVGAALLVGFLAAFFLDRFWDKFLDLFR
jgi:CDP-diglyceride synthetase